MEGKGNLQIVAQKVHAIGFGNSRVRVLLGAKLKQGVSLGVSRSSVEIDMHRLDISISAVKVREILFTDLGMQVVDDNDPSFGGCVSWLLFRGLVLSPRGGSSTHIGGALVLLG